MKRIAAVLMLGAFVAVGAAPAVGAQASPRRIALVYDLTLSPLFDGSGEPSSRATAHVDAFLRHVRAIETEHKERRVAVIIRGVACDELRLLGTAPARRALGSIRRIATRHRILPTTYADTRVEHREPDDLARAIRDNARAIERCAGVRPRGPFVPPGVSVTTTEATRALDDAGVDAILAAYAVPPGERRPRVVPSVLVRPEPAEVGDLAAVRPEAPGIAVVLDADRAALIAQLSEDERFQTVNIWALNDLDVIGGVIDDVADPSAEHVAAMKRTNAELELFRSYTLDDNPKLPVYETILARAEGTAWWGDSPHGIDLADDLRATLAAARRGITVSGGQITFTSRSGAVPVTIANQNDHPIRVLVELTTAKMRFENGNAHVVTIEPPGETVTFEATALSTGTFPVQIWVGDPRHRFEFGRSQVNVRSAAANLSAVVLTAGGALFLAYWFVMRLRKRKAAGP